MTQYQYQEQEDLMRDFDLPAEKEVIRNSPKDDEFSRRNARQFSSYKKEEALKPTITPNFFRQRKFSDAAENTKRINESMNKRRSEKGDEGTAVAGGEEIPNVLSCDMRYDAVFDDLSPESFAIMFEDLKKLWISFTAAFPNIFSLEDVLHMCTEVYGMTKEVVQEVVKYEEESKYLTAATLLIYGGSWTYLAGVVASIEAFGTQQVLEETWRVGSIFLSDDTEEEEDVTPAEIKDTLRELGLHIALLISITVSPSWAEICITVAFASKFAYLIPVKDTLKNTISMTNEESTELDEYFSIVDDSWFDLLAVVAANILSLTLFGCFPRLTTAMYLGYIGASIAIKSLINSGKINYHCDVDYHENFWMNKPGQFYIWGFVAAMSIWQALSGYTGYCVFLSWLMFLHPIVRAYNMIKADYEDKEYLN